MTRISYTGMSDSDINSDESAAQHLQSGWAGWAEEENAELRRRADRELEVLLCKVRDDSVGYSDSDSDDDSDCYPDADIPARLVKMI